MMPFGSGEQKNITTLFIYEAQAYMQYVQRYAASFYFP